MKTEPEKQAVKRPLTPVMEDYLEAIFDLAGEKRVVRVKDIAERLGVKMPSVSSMLATLESRGMVHYEKHEYLELTPEGEGVGREMRRRHKALLAFLKEILRIDQAIADDEACKMEHALSPETLDRLTAFMEFINVCPRAGKDWLAHFDEFRDSGKTPEKCRAGAQQFGREFMDKIIDGRCEPCGPCSGEN